MSNEGISRCKPFVDPKIAGTKRESALLQSAAPSYLPIGSMPPPSDPRSVPPVDNRGLRSATSSIVPDKSFLSIPKRDYFKDDRYINGCRAFLDFAYANPKISESGQIFCPCNKCKNRRKFNREVIWHHLMRNYYNLNYTFWDCHGESYVSVITPTTVQDAEPVRERIDGTNVMLQDLLNPSLEDNNGFTEKGEDEMDYEDIG